MAGLYFFITPEEHIAFFDDLGGVEYEYYEDVKNIFYQVSINTLAERIEQNESGLDVSIIPTRIRKKMFPNGYAGYKHGGYNIGIRYDFGLYLCQGKVLDQTILGFVGKKLLSEQSAEDVGELTLEYKKLVSKMRKLFVKGLHPRPSYEGKIENRYMREKWITPGALQAYQKGAFLPCNNHYGNYTPLPNFVCVFDEEDIKKVAVQSRK